MALTSANAKPSGTTHTIIVGAGIVGSCLAALLSTTQRVVLVDRSVSGLPGSTGHAPGYVGQYNNVPSLTELAKRTVARYRQIDGAFDGVGGLEVATSEEKLVGLRERGAQAQEVGLEAHVLTAPQVKETADVFVKEESVAGGLYFPHDGTANAQLIARHQQSQAQQNGALLLDADIVSIDHGQVRLNDGQVLRADRIVLCTGIWTRTLLPNLPILPVAHPYAYTAQRPSRDKKTPFVRYPEQHVYVRDHGRCDGIGSYAHDPIHVATDALTHSAYGDWQTSFQGVLSDAISLLPTETAAQIEVDPAKAGEARVFNGLFSVTPDGKPLLGAVKGLQGVFVASAIWVTHAAGCAQLLADMIKNKVREQDEWLVKELDVNRFDGAEWSELERKALFTYNDIYNKNAQ